MSRGLTLLVLPSLLALVACSEWRLSRQDTDCDDCETDSGDGEYTVCESREFEGASLEVVECEPEQGGWEARVLWETEDVEATIGLVADPIAEGRTLVVSNHPTGVWRVRDGRDGKNLHSPSWNDRLGDAWAYRNGSRILVADNAGFDGAYSVHDVLSGEVIAEHNEADLRAPRSEGCTTPDGRPADLDGDGAPEWIFGTVVLSSDLSEHQFAASDASGCRATAADINDDGFREVVTSVGVFRANGTPTCLISTEDVISGQTWVVDLDRNGIPEFVSVTRILGDREAHFSVYDADCQPWPASLSGGDVLRSVQGAEVLTVAPLLKPGVPALLIKVHGESMDGQLVDGAAVVDENLVVRTVIGRVQGNGVRAADLDADGVYELLAWSFRDGLQDTTDVIDARTGDILLNLDGYGSLPVDVDGDGHLEIIASTKDSMVVYNAANGEWAWGTRSWNDPRGFYPGLYLPDGSFAPPGRDWSRSGWYNAAANDGYLRGAGGELTVRIAEVCDDTCDRGRITAWVHPGNAGTKDVERPVRVTLGATVNGEEVVLDEEILDTLPAGRELPALELQGYEVEGIESVWARIEPHGWHWEGCTERPDEDVWAEGVCE